MNENPLIRILEAILSLLFFIGWVIWSVLDVIFRFVGDILGNARSRAVSYFGKIVFGVFLLLAGSFISLHLM